MKDRIIKRFTDQITALERELKVDLPKEIQRARELGDLRENAEYKSAKERQTLVEAQISILKKRMGEISLMNMDRIPKDKAGFGSTVHLRDETGKVVVYQLVRTPQEAQAVGFRGSPTALVDGIDPFADPVTPVGLSCRLY